MARQRTYWKVVLTVLVLIISIPILAFGFLVLNDSLAREYLHWATSVVPADLDFDDPFAPPMPLISAGDIHIEAGLGTISWMDGGRMIEGDMFMNTPQLARWRELRAGSIPLGTAVTILFPEPTRRIELSRWRFGKEV